MHSLHSPLRLGPLAVVRQEPAIASSALASPRLPRPAVFDDSKAFLTSFAESRYMEAAGTRVRLTSIAAELIHSESCEVAGIGTAEVLKAA